MTSDLSMAVIRSVQVGLVAALGPNGVPSGFRKSAAAGRVAVGEADLAS